MNLTKKRDCMKRRNLISILLYLLGAILFIISNSSVVSGSPIHFEYFQRVIFCVVAVGSIALAPFVYKTKTAIGTIIKFIISIALILCIFAFGGFEDNVIAGTISLF